jgi:hypothetical protein
MAPVNADMDLRLLLLFFDSKLLQQYIYQHRRRGKGSLCLDFSSKRKRDNHMRVNRSDESELIRGGIISNFKIINI